jgi:hypothetical protein
MEVGQRIKSNRKLCCRIAYEERRVAIDVRLVETDCVVSSNDSKNRLFRYLQGKLSNIIDKWLMKGQLDLCNLRFGLVDFVALPIDWRNLLSLSLCFGNIALKIVCFVVFVDKRLSCFALFLAGLKSLSTIASALIACVSLETLSVCFQDQTSTIDSIVFCFSLLTTTLLNCHMCCCHHLHQLGKKNKQANKT